MVVVFADRLSKSYVEVKAALTFQTCGFIDNSNQDTITVACPEAMVGRYLRIRRTGDGSWPSQMFLCEVMVIGYRYEGKEIIVQFSKVLLFCAARISHPKIA